MTIKNILGNPGVGPLAGAKGTQKAKPAKTDPVSPQDRVEFSTVLKEVGRAGEAAGTPDAQRAQKVAQLKAQIASGNYRPDLTKVAASLLKFITEEK